MPFMLDCLSYARWFDDNNIWKYLLVVYTLPLELPTKVSNWIIRFFRNFVRYPIDKSNCHVYSL